MKKIVITILLLIVICIVIAGNIFIKFGLANPYIRDWKLQEVIPVPEGTKLPTITIFNPQNNTFYASRNLQLNFSVTIEWSNNISLSIIEMYYLSNWRIGKTEIDMHSIWRQNNNSYPSTFCLNITNVPEGSRWIQVYAVAMDHAWDTGHSINGVYYTTYYVAYQTISNATVQFTVDMTAPEILSLSIQNKTYESSTIPLTLKVDEPISQVIYSLDNQTNVIVANNSTLTNLSNGYHNITFYAIDMAGNIGSLETVFFNVDVPFPIMPVTASIGIVAIVVSSLLIYFKKHKQLVKKF